jgi:hypothetical protein
MCAFIVSPMHATCPTPFIHDSLVKSKNYRRAHYDTRYAFPTLLSHPQVQMFSKLPFTTYVRHVWVNGLLYQGKELLKNHPNTKSSSG